MRIAARRTQRAGRRDLIGAWHRPHSGVSTDRTQIPFGGDRAMVTLGSDSHKRTHTVVAVDGNGRQLGSRTVMATSAGHLEALHWARQWPERRWRTADTCRGDWRVTSWLP